MEDIIIYEKPTCSKCRIAIGILDEHGTPYSRIRYHDIPLTKNKLAELVQKLGIVPHELLRRTDPSYRKLKINPEALNDEEVISLMIEHPDLMQRPILERGESAIIGRPPERVLEFLKTSPDLLI